MIPSTTLIRTIDDFVEKFQEIDKQCRESKEPSDCHLEYFKMDQAWCKFQDAVEYNLLPFTEQT